jgi:AAA family ATP:ADP antiporter
VPTNEKNKAILLAREVYVTAETFTQFLGRFGQIANGMALFFSLVGTSYFIRKFGVTFCLTLFPILTGLVLTVVYIFPNLWIVFGGMVTIRALTYALNNPSKKIKPYHLQFDQIFLKIE